MFATYTVMEYMSTQKGGNGGVIVNVASMAGINLCVSVCHWVSWDTVLQCTVH